MAIKNAQKVSINQLDKIIKMQAEQAGRDVDDNKRTISYHISDDETIEIEVINLLSIEKVDDMVDAVVEALFQDDIYKPALEHLIWGKAILGYYSNIKTNMTNDKLNYIIYKTDILEKVLNEINKKQLQFIKDALQNAIIFKEQSIHCTQKIRLEQEQEEILKHTNDLINTINTTMESFAVISQMFDGLSKDQIMEILSPSKIIHLDERDKEKND